MSDPNTLGRLVRRRRLESGYSLGQLASKVGKTAAEVRAWERDTELPEHGIIERLAETLELDLDEIKARLAAESDEETADTVAAEATVADAAEQAEPTGDAELAGDIGSTGDEVPATAAEVVVAAEIESEGEMPEELEDEPGFPVEDPFTAPAAEDDADDEAASAEPEFDLFDAPTEPVPVPIITETATAARAERAVAVLEEPAPLPMVEPAPDADLGLLRYLEPVRILFDPNSRYLYWIRAGFTIVVMMIFTVILFNQFGNLLDAVGELLDTIEPTATTPDDLDALGPAHS